jgi:very-short-patch-repair endonuclease
VDNRTSGILERHAALVPRPAARPSALAGRVFRGSRVVADGILTRKQLRSSAWVRLRQDVYADVALPITHRVLTSAVGLVLPEGAGFGGRSAAGLWGVTDLAGPEDPVEVLLPAGTRWNAGNGVRCRSLLPAQQLVQAGRWRATSPVDTAVDILRFVRRDESVVVLDHLVHAGMVALEDVRGAVREIPPCFGAVRAREAAARADGLAESQQETRLRLLMLDAGLPLPVAQFRVRDDQGFVARVDFAFPELRLAIEYDGLWHAERAAFMADRRRLDRLTAAGWTVLHVTAEDMRHPARLVVRIRAAISRQQARAEAR